jgi:hypothetical protein
MDDRLLTAAGCLSGRVSESPSGPPIFRSRNSHTSRTPTSSVGPQDNWVYVGQGAVAHAPTGVLHVWGRECVQRGRGGAVQWLLFR